MEKQTSRTVHYQDCNPELHNHHLLNHACDDQESSTQQEPEDVRVEHLFWLGEITKLKGRLAVPVEGVTFTEQYRQNLLASKYVMLSESVVLSNYTRLELKFSAPIFHSGRIQPRTIPGQTMEMIRHCIGTVYIGNSPIKDELYYKIGSTGIVLCASYVLPLNGTNKGSCSVTLTRKGISYSCAESAYIANCGSLSPMEQKNLKIKGRDATGSDKSDTLGRIVVKCDNFVAMAELKKKGDVGLQLYVDLMEYAQESQPPKTC